MADERVVESIVKSDVCWAELSIGRHPVKGLDIWVRTVPDVEDFFKSLSKGGFDPVEAYNKDWKPYSAGPLLIYRMEQSLPEAGTYTLQTPGAPMKTADKLGRGAINLSFLRIKGISSPEGVRFFVKGIYSRPFTEQISDEVLKQIRFFIRDYIVPVTINLRISSQLV